MSGVTRFSASVDPALLSEFDALLGESGINRSSAIESAMRNYIVENKWSSGGGHVAGAFILLYDHHSHGVTESLTDAQHDYTDVISSTVHVHLDRGSCLEIVAVRGPAARLHELKRTIEAVRGLKQIRYNLVNA